MAVPLLTKKIVKKRVKKFKRPQIDRKISVKELYPELNAFERFEQDYQRKLEEMQSLNLPRGGAIFHNELEEQRKLVRRLKNKSLWSRNLEEIVKKFLDVVASIHQAIWDAFRNSSMNSASQNETSPICLSPIWEFTLKSNSIVQRLIAT